MMEMTLQQLPTWNRAMTRGEISFEEFLEPLKAPAVELSAAARAVGDRAAARRLLGALGMLVSSSERHAQALGLPRGYAVGRLGVDEALCRLGVAGDHPPRDSAYTFWIWNTDGWSFTGDQQEALFGRVVRGTVEGWEAATARLRFISDPRVPHTAPEVLQYLQHATELQRLNNQLLAALAARDRQTRAPAFDGDFFTFDFRTWLTTYPIRGRTWEGPSAANFAAVFEMDLRLAPPSPFYEHYVRGRLHALPGEEQRRVEAALLESTIEDKLLGLLGTDRGRLAAMDDATVDAQVHAGGLATFLAALEEYVEAVTLWTKRHLGLVRRKLEEPAARAGASAPRLPIDPLRGTGGGDWRMELVSILEERANPRTLRRLFAAARRVNQE